MLKYVFFFENNFEEILGTLRQKVTKLPQYEVHRPQSGAYRMYMQLVSALVGNLQLWGLVCQCIHTYEVLNCLTWQPLVPYICTYSITYPPRYFVYCIHMQDACAVQYPPRHYYEAHYVCRYYSNKPGESLQCGSKAVRVLVRSIVRMIMSFMVITVYVMICI